MLKKSENLPFYGVALTIIVLGATIFTVGAVAWLFNYFGSSHFSYPFNKVMGGAIITALGYIQLEIMIGRSAEK